MYRLIIAPQAQKQLKNIQQSYQTAIKLSLKDIKEAPGIGKPLTRELIGKFSYRVGVYRIIYKVNDKEQIVHILSAGHRSTIYNK